MKKLLFIALAFFFISSASFAQYQQQNIGTKNNTIIGVKSHATPFSSNKGQTAVLTYADNAIAHNLGTGGTFTTNAFAYFPTSSFSSHVGETIFEISVGVGDVANITSLEVCIWTDTTGHGATAVMSQTVPVSSLHDGWNDIILSSPYTLGSSNIFVGYRLSTSGYSIGCDNTPDASGNGDMLQDPTDGSITHLGAINFGDLSIMAHVGTLDNVEAELVSINNSEFILASASSIIGITGTIKNNGANDITSYDVTYSINNGTPVAAYTVTPPQPIATGNTSSFVHNVTADFSTAGTYNVHVAISNINGSNDDTNASNDTLSKAILSANEFYQRNVVYEEATGTWCGWCVRGLVGLNTMANNVTDGTWIGIGVHDNDPMAVTEYDNAIGNFIGGYPSGVMNRIPNEIDPGLSTLQSAYNTQKAVPSIAKIEITNKTYDPSTRAWSLDVKTTFGVGMTNANFNTALIIVENNVKGTTSGYNQANYYSGGTHGDMIDYDGRNYANMPNPVPAADMVYNHVGRVLVDGFNGSANSVPTSVTYNTPNTFSYSGTLSANIIDWRSSFVALIIDNATGEIVNATELSLGNVGINNPVETKYNIYPNPTTGKVVIEGAKNSQITVYNMVGEIVYTNDNISNLATVDLSAFNSGNYIVRIVNKNKVTYHKVILIK